MNKKNKRKHTRKILFIIYSIAVLVAVFIHDGPRAIMATYSSANKPYLLIALSFIFFYWMFDSFTLAILISIFQKPPTFYKCFQITMSGQLFSALTPFSSGGQPMQVYQLNKFDVPVGLSSSIVLIVLNLFHFARIVLSIVLLFIYNQFFFREIKNFVFLIIVGISLNITIGFIITSFILFPIASKKIILRFINWLSRMKLISKTSKYMDIINNEIDAFYESFYLIARHGINKLLLALLFTFAQLFFLCSIPYFIFMSLGFSANFLLVFTGTLFVNLIASVVPLPGGSVGAEASFYLIMSAIYPNCEVLGLILLLWRLVTYYSALIFGNLFTLNIKKNIKDITITKIE